jgi:hypothetical protein
MAFSGITIAWLRFGMVALDPGEGKNASILPWRRVAAVAGMVLVTISIALGAFAWAYWRRFPGPEPGPPKPTYIATYAGVYLMLAALPLSLCAKGGVRIALLLCCSGLFGFYFLMFLPP